MLSKWKDKVCMFCKAEPASFPINIPSEGNGVLCDECTKQIPDYVFLRCSRCKTTYAIKADEHYKEDTIMEACFKQGMNKLEVARELITTQWKPLVLIRATCDVCSDKGDE